MRHSNWVDPGGEAANGFVPKPHPIRQVTNAIVVVGLLFWVWLPVQIVKLVTGRNRS